MSAIPLPCVRGRYDINFARELFISHAWPDSRIADVKTDFYILVCNRYSENDDVINRSVGMETKLQVLLLLATLLGATYLVVSDDAVVEDFYQRFNSSRGADLVFVLDKSGSVSRRLWISMLNFVKVSTLHFGGVARNLFWGRRKSTSLDFGIT